MQNHITQIEAYLKHAVQEQKKLENKVEDVTQELLDLGV